MSSIRDFIYLDVERLYSVYSQVFEGVADQIIQSYIDSEQQTASSKHIPLISETDTETKVVEVSRRTENKFLYDHMYNLLEERISQAIIDISVVSKDQYRQTIEKSFAIKVVGIAEIEDFQRTRDITEKYNELGGAINYISSFDNEKWSARKVQIAQLQTALNTTVDKNQKPQIRKALKAVEDELTDALQSSATNKKLFFDEHFLKQLTLLVDTYYPDRFDVTIVPRSFDENIAFRGVLDKKWLRVQPYFLRSLYSGVAQGWTMVGQVTRFPDAESIPTDVQPEDSVNHSTLRDGYLELTRRMYDLEKTFTVSGYRSEFVVSPLAIYRESVLPT